MPSPLKRAKKAPNPRPRVAANGYRLCDPLPEGTVLTDLSRREWVLGQSIGSGGFGDIYSCRKRGDRTDQYVIKLDNKCGPLFQEMNFYMRVAKEDDIQRFIARHRLQFLGMPRYVSSGTHFLADKRSAKELAANKRNAPTLEYRFLVMQRFGDQLEDWVKQKKLNAKAAAEVAIEMIDVLEYIHSFGYIHGDIKGPNILKSLSSKSGNDWYLVDFGLAEKYLNPNGRHREEEPDKKRANNGTVEYRSRDAHVGQLSRRSDIECLAYNLIVWLNGTLPWMSALKDANRVQKLKEDFFDHLDTTLNKCFNNSVPKGLNKFFESVDALSFDSEPNYSGLKECLKSVTSSSTANSPQKSPLKSRAKSPAKPPPKSLAKPPPKSLAKPPPKSLAKPPPKSLAKPPPKSLAKPPPKSLAKPLPKSTPRVSAKSPPKKTTAKSKANTSATRRSPRSATKRYIEVDDEEDDDYEEEDSVICLN